MNGRGALAAAAGICLAASLAGQTAAPSPRVTRARTPAARAKPALDFTGVWELDPKESRNISQHMVGAVLSVRQNGNRIWIEPIEQTGPRLLAEQIVVDGKRYEKRVGKEKGTLVAEWSQDGSSLLLQVETATEENPAGAVQRMVWRLHERGNTWTRQTWTVQGESVRQTYLVFRKRSKATNAPSNPKRTPKAAPTPD